MKQFFLLFMVACIVTIITVCNQASAQNQDNYYRLTSSTLVNQKEVKRG